MSLPARSLPARSLPSPSPSAPRRQHPDRAARPARPPAARPDPATPPQRRARRGSTPAFWLLSAVVVTGLVMVVVALNALVVNATYRMTEVERQVQALQEVQDDREIEIARLSSPSRIADWAVTVGMVVPGPGESVILRVPGDRNAR